MSRPFVIDEKKKQKIVTMVHWGVSITAIADYLGCDRRTIQRLRREDSEFDDEVRAAGIQAQLKPLDCLRQAASKHWRAAAYLLEREERREAERHDRQRAAARQARLDAIRDEVKRVIQPVYYDPRTRIEVELKLEALFTDSTTTPHTNTKRPKASRELLPSWRKAALALEQLTPLVEAARQALDDSPELGEVRYRPEKTERPTERQVEPRLAPPATTTTSFPPPPPFICPTKRGRGPGLIPRGLGNSDSTSPFAR
ncbi:helix-turn-helix domain-containing protein [Aeoliella sp. SH292]|uniref:helix-turn-helix domain-containing protein n=1 Tax=Aeoliella sp. SH292 TaxID=3454464 RepID=UPI003F95CB2E